MQVHGCRKKVQRWQLKHGGTTPNSATTAHCRLHQFDLGACVSSMMAGRRRAPTSFPPTRTALPHPCLMRAAPAAVPPARTHRRALPSSTLSGSPPQSPCLHPFLAQAGVARRGRRRVRRLFVLRMRSGEVDRPRASLAMPQLCR